MFIIIARWTTAVLIISLLLACSEPQRSGVKSVFNKPIYLGYEIKSEAFEDLCDETEINNLWTACIIKRDKLTAYFLLENGKVSEIKVMEKLVDGMAKTIESEHSSLNMNSDPIKLLGLGDYYHQENDYVLRSYTAPHKNGNLIMDEVTLHISSTNFFDVALIDKFSEISESGRIEYGGFMLGDEIISRNPAEFVCNTYKPLDITECLHENYWYYLESYDDEENRFIEKKTPHNSVDVLWLDRTRVVGMKKFFDGYDTTVQNLVETFGGNRRFSRIVTGSKNDSSPDVFDSLYTVNENDDVVIIQNFLGLIELELHYGKSATAQFFLENQQHLSTQ